MRRTPIILLLTLLLALCAPFARADIVTLKDGTTHEGVVVKENGAEVVLEITIANIKTTKKFPRYKVRSIEYKPVEDDQAQKDEREDRPAGDNDADDADDDNEADEDDASARTSPRSARRRATPRASRRTMFVVIPVEGMIGVHSNAHGVSEALKQAKRKGIRHVVFAIDSGGGFLYDAIETLKVLKEYDDEMTYHALVEGGAISAASIYVAASDHIWVRSDARVGGAVAYSESTSSGAIEVDAKFNSIWAAEIAARAHSKGHPPEVFRAMAEPGAEVWIDDEGKVYPSRPSAPGALQIDNSRTVLTIRADQMVKIGMAKVFDGPVRELGERLDIADWSEAPGIGVRAMKRAGDERVKLNERMSIAEKFFLEQIEDFVDNDPRRHTDYRAIRLRDDRYRRGDSNEFAPDGPSNIKWRDRSNAALANCDHMLDALREMANVLKRAEKISAKHLVFPAEQGDYSFEVIQEIRQWLWDNRNRVPNEMFIDGAKIGP